MIKYLGLLILIPTLAVAGEDQPKTRKYVAVCEPRKIDPEKVSIYK